MRKWIIAAATVATLAVPTAAMANQPSMGFTPTNSNSQGSTVGQNSSQIKQNGPWVSQTQTQTPGERAQLNQISLGHTNPASS